MMRFPLFIICLVTCAIAFETYSNRISNGRIPYLGMFPSVARLDLTFAKAGTFQCMAVLIEKDWLLLAAHCLYRGNSDILITGFAKMNTINATNENSISRDIRDFYLHPQFNNNTFNNDIALIKLTESFELTSTLNVAVLPDGDIKNDDIEDDEVIVVGYGYNKDPTKQNLLYWGRMQIERLRLCQKKYKTENSIFCIGINADAEACPESVNEPIFWYSPKQKKYVLLGFVSLDHLVCGTFPIGITHIPTYTQWINETINL